MPSAVPTARPRLPVRLRAPRLALARLAEADLPDLRAMHADPRVMATLGGVRNEAETRAFSARVDAHWARHGFGYWTARSTDGAYLDRGGLLRVHVGRRAGLEVGYALVASAWGRGLATELARESVRLGFSSLDVASIVCFTLPGNAASRRVMDKA